MQILMFHEAKMCHDAICYALHIALRLHIINFSLLPNNTFFGVPLSRTRSDAGISPVHFSDLKSSQCIRRYDCSYSIGNLQPGDIVSPLKMVCVTAILCKN